MSSKVYKIITDKIVEKLKDGIVPWHQPWKSTLPMNIITKNQYHGFNLLYLSIQDYNSPYWGTYKQFKKLGGFVEKGQKSTMITFWKINEYETNNRKGEPEKKTGAILRYYNVFNIEQTTLKDDEKYDVENNHNDTKTECENIVDGYKNHPEIVHDDKNRAFFNHINDLVNIPDIDTFETSEKYYSVLFHELTHSTGHHTRLARRSLDEYRKFGDEKYSKEELIAELGAAFLSGYTGILKETIEASAGYIDSWIHQLQNDNTLIISASGKAQKSTDYILNQES